jgi:hypothetical protein
VVLQLLAKLQNSKTDWTILTEVPWALGKISDKRAIQPLYDLDKKLQAIRDPDNLTLPFTQQKKDPTRLAGIGQERSLAFLSLAEVRDLYSPRLDEFFQSA